jgi:sulfide:quinone oxidoreductase
MNRVLILGGGFGGLATAHRLKQQLNPRDEVILVDRSDHFAVGFRKTWELVGMSAPGAGHASLDRLARKGIQVIRESVNEIDPPARAAVVGEHRMEADALVIALGAELAPEAVPGLAEQAFNVYDAEDIPRASKALKEFRGGMLMIGIFGNPYKCPPAPFEMALLINESFRARRVEAAVEVFSPQPMSLPVLGQVGCDVIEGRLAENGITFLPNHKATSVEAGQVVFASARRPFDLLFAVPPHQPPSVVRESGLVDDSGWVPVDPRTLETHSPGVYAIGDVVQIMMANGKPLPKAGVFAEAMGEVVADRISAQSAGKSSDAAFRGEGGCYLEVGGGLAMMVQGRFLAEPEPEVTLTDPSPRYLDEKRAFETQRLQMWFN